MFPVYKDGHADNKHGYDSPFIAFGVGPLECCGSTQLSFSDTVDAKPTRRTAHQFVRTHPIDRKAAHTGFQTSARHRRGCVKHRDIAKSALVDKESGVEPPHSKEKQKATLLRFNNFRRDDDPRLP
jgi:hypothetical protein